jgi:hypothetical protein
MEIKLTKEEKLNFFYDALCNGLGSLRDYNLQLEFNEEDYFEFKKKLTEENPKIAVCYEDVLMEMIKNGKVLNIIDEGYDGEYNAIISLDTILSNMEKTPIENLMNIYNENADAWDADVLLQTVLYGEIIFG